MDVHCIGDCCALLIGGGNGKRDIAYQMLTWINARDRVAENAIENVWISGENRTGTSINRVFQIAAVLDIVEIASQIDDIGKRFVQSV